MPLAMHPSHPLASAFTYRGMTMVRLILVGLVCHAVGCGTKRNEAVCCTTEEDCAEKGLSPDFTCGQGLVCVKNECIDASCQADSDCFPTAPFCAPEGSCVECLDS